MATQENITEAPTSIISDEFRQRIALSACWEIESLASLIAGMVTNNTDIKYLALRGIAQRITSLNNVVMGAIWDDAESNAELQESLGFNVVGMVNHG